MLDVEHTVGLIAGLLFAAAVGWRLGWGRGYRTAYREAGRPVPVVERDQADNDYPFC
jgi:hypothetical protein